MGGVRQTWTWRRLREPGHKSSSPQVEALELYGLKQLGQAPQSSNLTGGISSRESSELTPGAFVNSGLWTSDYVSADPSLLAGVSTYPKICL